MTLPIIMTHLWKNALLYHVRWYHCSKQELRRNCSKSRCDVIADDISIIKMVFDRVRYIDYDSSVNLSYGPFFLKSHMVTRGGIRRTLKPKVKPKLEYHSSLATIHFIFFILILYLLTELQPFKYQGHLVKLWPCPLTYDIEKSRVLRSFPDMHTLEIWLRYYSNFTGHWSSNWHPKQPHEYRGK